MLHKNKIWKEAASSLLVEYVIIPYLEPYFTVCRYGLFFRHVIFHACKTLVFKPENHRYIIKEHIIAKSNKINCFSVVLGLTLSGPEDHDNSCCKSY